VKQIILRKPPSRRDLELEQVDENLPIERPEKPSPNIDRHSFAAVFDEAEALVRNKVTRRIPPGNYKGRIRELVMQEPLNNARQVRLKIDLCDHPQYGGDEIVTWFSLGKFHDGENGAESGWRINTVARDILYKSLAVLSYEPTNFASLEEICREVSAEEPVITFKLVYRGDVNQFVNVTILGRLEMDDEI
jgi:hypothetical protein